MQDIIVEKLKAIEQAENVQIIHAVESGSRAWGFASPDSDYDVRFIYVRPVDFYLRLEKTSDVIQWQLDETLDINCWDLQKALRLLHKSNPTLFEWNNSPIIYKTTPHWACISAEINNYFSAKAGLYHYLNTAKTNYREYLKGEMVKLKKYFYVIRPLLACKWIIHNNCPPPMLFSELAKAQLEKELQPVINDLLRQKMSMPEMGQGKRINQLNDYIEKNIVSLKPLIDAMPEKHRADWGRLNELFLKIIR